MGEWGTMIDGLTYIHTFGEYRSPMERSEKMSALDIHNFENVYGWLSPSGRFYPVDWGQHDSWAGEHIKELVDWDSLSLKERISSAGLGDVLMNRGWVLLHNPSHGLAFPTRKPDRRYTKAQADFLYGYYTDLGEREKADAILRELD